MAQSRRQPKKPARKSVDQQIWSDGSQWTVGWGRLVPDRGCPSERPRLFSVVGEKLPIEAPSAVRRDIQDAGFRTEGIYVAHDSMGYAGYVGRGHNFTRLKARKRESGLEIRYFSFYVVEENHEREIETLLVRVAAPLLYFNERKKRLDLMPGSIRDYEPGTECDERHYRRGRARAAK